MNKKLFLTLLLSMLVLTPMITLAVDRDLEIEYPRIVPTINPPQTVKTILPDYIRYVINLVFILSGLIIFGSLLFAGFSRLTSGVNPGALSQANDRVWSSFIGAIILLSSYLILNTINPTLVQLKIGAPTLGTGGVVLKDASGREIETAFSLKDFDPYFKDFYPISAKIPTTHTEIIPCFEKDLQDCREDQKISVDTDGAEASLPSNILSIIITWKIPGVYLYPETNFGGKPSVYTSNYGDLGDFDNKAQSIEFVNTADVEYGAVLHEDKNFKGKCEVVNEGEISNLSGIRTSSITVFRRDPDISLSGSKAYFYSWPDYVGITINYADVPNKMTGSLANTASTASTLGTKTRSLKIDRGIQIALFESNGQQGKCEIFSGNDSDLSNNEMGTCLDFRCVKRVGTTSICLWSWWVKDSCVKSFEVILGK